MSGRLTVTAAVTDHAGSREIAVRGQTAKALLALVESGRKGATAADVAGWAYRFAAYCHDLKRNHGLVIRTDREPHPGGWHGRHVLESRVAILSVDGIDGDA
ncbi:winged helix domain-containing protein [Oceanibacterium hippocampi]|uniref:Winged helix domain-containing protein n=1 Tax=Oceanibacterium hippocampi TaxID=745714 RepID=A0A1Y5RN55_9PROT|nr:hypothetical protein [Oceanibacterium hippocampi]SLN18697.1 hypothetical protein OCH7691_00406 [Oceanibacterium hippocampi]